MDNLHHHLTGLYGCEHVLAQGFCLYGVGEGFRNLKVYVGVEQGTAHVLKGFGNVYFGYFALAFKELEASLKAFA